jgi:RNA polymerase sigma-70 factor (ECF subfamily)
MEHSDWERELEQLHPDSWGWALACCGRDRELAEEVLQMTYLRILSGHARFGGGSSIKTWVFGVIRLTAVGELRRRSVWRERHTGQGSAMQVADVAKSADETGEAAEQREALTAALADLSPRQREVLQLVFYHDMTIREAAGVMNTSLGSARTHYERGKKALAQRLAGKAVR